MIEFGNREDAPSLYAVSLCHFLFGYVRPFYEGNGKTGRDLLALSLNETLSQPTVMSLSRTIAENKTAYYKAFDVAERPLNGSEATPFVAMMLDLIEQAQDAVLGDLIEMRTQLKGLEMSIEELDGSFTERAKDIRRGPDAHFRSLW